MRRYFTLMMVILSLTLLGTCFAATFPEKPIKYIIPFAPGGESDIAAKLQLKELENILGQKIEIDYITGAGGATAWEELKKAKPDGYTIMGTALPHNIIQPLQNAAYKTEDINVVYIFNSTPVCLMVAQDSPFKNLGDLIKYAKANPSIVTIGMSGMGSANHLAIVELAKAAHVKLTYVPYSGSSTALPALLAHKVSAVMIAPALAISNPNDVRVLAVSSEKRFSYFPDVPTFKERGYKVIEGVYRGIAVPPGTPVSVMKTLEAAFTKVNKNPEFKTEMEKAGFKLEYYGSEASKKFIASKQKYYQELFKELDLGK